MKNNTLVMKDKNGKQKEYRILFNIESYENKINYVIYTDDSKDKNGEITALVSTYEKSEKGNMTKMKQIKNEEEFDFIEKILNSLQN